MALEILYDARPRWPEPFAIRTRPRWRDRVALWLRETGWCAGSRPMPHAVKPRARPREPPASRIAAARKRTGDG